MENATQRLIDLVRVANADCTDYRVGKLLGVSTSAVSRWRTGVGHMSQANVIAACKAAGIKDAWRWVVYVGAEREQGPDGDFYREVREDFEAIERGRKPKKGGYLYTLIHGLPGNVASVLLGLLAAATLATLPTQRVVASTAERPASVSILCKAVRRWLQRLRSTLGAGLAGTPPSVIASAF